MTTKGRPAVLGKDQTWANISIRVEREMYLKLREASLAESKMWGRHIGMTEIVRSAIAQYLAQKNGETND